jgi:hypothetical protein
MMFICVASFRLYLFVVVLHERKRVNSGKKNNICIILKQHDGFREGGLQK